MAASPFGKRDRFYFFAPSAKKKINLSPPLDESVMGKEHHRSKGAPRWFRYVGIGSPRPAGTLEGQG